MQRSAPSTPMVYVYVTISSTLAKHFRNDTIQFYVCILSHCESVYGAECIWKHVPWVMRYNNIVKENHRVLFVYTHGDFL